MTGPAARIYQIFYDEASRAALAPEAIPLDNRDGPPGWYEFGAILNYLRHHDLDEDCFYAFLSPAFPEKSGFTIAQVHEIAERERARDLIIFSSYWLGPVMARNLWVQGEGQHPGLLERAQDFFRSIDVDTDLARTTTDSTTAAFSNYFVGKPVFWRKWQELAEKYHAYVEAGGPDGPHEDVTDYRGQNSVAFKVFIQERLCSHVLLENDFDTFVPEHPLPEGLPIADPERARAILRRMDDLKRRYRATGNPIHLIHHRWLGTAFSRASRGGTMLAWLAGALGRKLRAALR